MQNGNNIIIRTIVFLLTLIHISYFHSIKNTTYCNIFLQFEEQILYMHN